MAKKHIMNDAMAIMVVNHIKTYIPSINGGMTIPQYGESFFSLATKMPGTTTWYPPFSDRSKLDTVDYIIFPNIIQNKK